MILLKYLTVIRMFVMMREITSSTIGVLTNVFSQEWRYVAGASRPLITN